MALMDQIDLFIQGWFPIANSNAEALVRLVLAACAGGLTGLERESRGREAGFRTNILICMGSALTMVVSTHVPLLELHPVGHLNINTDPARIAYGVMAGIGFLGSGAIVREGSFVRGLTTAANIWCMAAVGLAIGLGLYGIGIVSVLLVLLVLTAFHQVEHVFPRLYRRRLVIRKPWSADCLEQVEKRFTSPHYDLKNITLDRSRDTNEVDFTVQLACRRQETIRNLERDLLADKDFQLITSGNE